MSDYKFKRRQPPPSPYQEEVDAFVASARFSDTVAITNFLNKYPAFIDQQSSSGHTALTKAAAHGQKETVELLLAKGARIEEKGENKKTALLWASHNGHKETVRALLDNKADITASYNDGLTPLIIASWSGHTATTELLVEKGAPVDEACKTGATPLILAAAFAKTDTVRFLIEKGAAIDKADNIGRTALTMPRFPGSEEMVALLEKGLEMQLQHREKELALAQSQALAKKLAEELAVSTAKALSDARFEKLKAQRPPQSPFKKGPT